MIFTNASTTTSWWICIFLCAGFFEMCIRDRFYTEQRACYEDGLNAQVAAALAQKGEGDLDKLLKGRDVWEIH